MFQSMFPYEWEVRGQEIQITKCLVESGRAEVPEEIDGKPVTGIGDYAFSGSGIRSLELPVTIRRIGRYAFYLCAGLEELSFWSELGDIGAGSFTGCHQIRTIRIYMETETSILRDVLLEIPEELTVEYRRGSERAVLAFPEFYEEGVENTPARIIEHHTHGSGMFYRNCFVARKFQFAEYDSRFPYAIGQENVPFLSRLVLGRLRYPYELSDKAKEIYENWLRGHFEEVLDLYSERKDVETISFLMSFHRKEKKPGKRKWEI